MLQTLNKKEGWPVMPFILFIKLIREDFIWRKCVW